jgi:16S rRNA (uracil1498-N3)-methyltransferase
MTPRIYSAAPLASCGLIVLDAIAARHLREALRLARGDAVVLFDGRGGEYAATVTMVSRERVEAQVGAHLAVDRESPLAITLAQGISRGERMDYTLQKAVELGVQRIVPLATERSTVRLDESRARKRLEHWQGIVRHACEQSGRTALPPVDEIAAVPAFAAVERAALKLMLDPAAAAPLAGLTPAMAPPPDICLAIGPEGGFSPGERAVLDAAGFIGARLGPRVLRTETAALVALSVLQSRLGDLG